MKTLVISGAVRKEEYSNQLLDYFLDKSTGEIKIIEAYHLKNIRPCKDCRYCFKNFGCCIKDNMQEIYTDINAADIVVLAAPINSYSVPGVMKIILDRCQPYWAGNIRKDKDTYKRKKGVIFMVDSEPSFPNQFLGGELVFNGLLNDIRATKIGMITIANSDSLTAADENTYYDDTKKLAARIYGETF